MMQAIISEDRPTMDLLLKAGASLTATGIICDSSSRNHVWTNAIGAAAFLGSSYILPKLVKVNAGGIDHKAVETSDRFGVVKHEFTGYTPLMLAVASEDTCLDCVKILVKAGACKKVSDVFGDGLL